MAPADVEDRPFGAGLFEDDAAADSDTSPLGEGGPGGDKSAGEEPAKRRQ